MRDLLSRINSPKDLKRLGEAERKELCAQIREFLINSVSETGGHLASNLGVVELTVALHTVFDVPVDKLIWDVGHQAYVHKILTGRRDKFDTLRKYQGLSGFPKTSESEYDCFNTGHSSTSVSAALGFARARDLKNENHHVIAVLGDGALTGGMVNEAMNDAGRAKTRLIVILNDNYRSIAENVGAMAKYLKNLRISPGYIKFKSRTENRLMHIPLIGNPIIKLLYKIKKVLRLAVVRSTLFEDMGFYYMGPVDGHNVERLITTLEQAKNETKPVFLHVCTKKGKGYLHSEKHPAKYHGVAPFDRESGEVITDPVKDYSEAFGDKLCELAEKNEKIVAITGAMPFGTGLYNFSKKFPGRFFDVGIAEQHAVTLAAGLAADGIVPVVPLYSSFLQRAYDQVLHDVCLQNLHVVFPIDRAGVVGADGETHQGIYDISFLSHMPNMTILSPANFEQLGKMLDYAVNECTGPVAIRYPRGNTQADVPSDFNVSEVRVLKEGTDVCIIATGRMIKTAQEVCKRLPQCGLVAVPVICPLDEAGIAAQAMNAGLIITIEDNVYEGGMGQKIGAMLNKSGIHTSVKCFAFPQKPIIHGTVAQLDKHYKMDADSIVEYIKSR